MGELFNSLWDCVPLIKEQWIDYIRCDLGPHRWYHRRA
jgi:hypothetical protein